MARMTPARAGTTADNHGVYTLRRDDPRSRGDDEKSRLRASLEAG